MTKVNKDLRQAEKIECSQKQSNEKDELELYFEDREKNDPEFKTALEELQRASKKS